MLLVSPDTVIGLLLTVLLVCHNYCCWLSLKLHFGLSMGNMCCSLSLSLPVFSPWCRTFEAFDWGLLILGCKVQRTPFYWPLWSLLTVDASFSVVSCVVCLAAIDLISLCRMFFLLFLGIPITEFSQKIMATFLGWILYLSSAVISIIPLMIQWKDYCMHYTCYFGTDFFFLVFKISWYLFCHLLLF